MSRKKMIMFGMVVGSVAGGYMPALLGVDDSSMMISLLGSLIGGILGILIAFNLA
jgi:hypothetical protein